MKTLSKLFSIGAMALLLMLMAPNKSMAQDDGYVSDQEFYDELQQYGTWVQDDQYGDVWVPDVDGDFRPYATNGYWVQTDYGTTWVSDYPWGWATFHYGRWRYDDYYGWEWLPGHEWAPAWVSWRQGGGYYGWAPMGPGISLTLSLGGLGLSIGNDYWVYAPQRYITSRYVSRYYAPRTQVSIIIRKTTYIRNTYVYNKRTYITGPRPRDIQKITRKKVTVYKINNAGRPGAFKVGTNNTINIYRPAIKKAPDARPVRVVSATGYKNEHPTEGIGKRGATGYNHGNAAKLASIARSDNPNSKIVKVNPRKPGENKPNEPAKTNEPNKANVPSKGNEPNKPNEPVKGNEPNKPNEPALNNHHVAPGGNKGTEPKGNENQSPANNGESGKGHHKTAPTQPAQQPAVNKPVEQPANNTPAQTTPAGEVKGHKHKPTPAVMPAEQHNADQTQQQQAKEQEQQQKQEAAQQQKQQQQQAQQAAREQAQQQKQQQQQAQQQQRAQQQQAQQAAREQAQQQQKQQQQQAQQQQRAQQQQAQQAAREQAQQQQKQQQQQAQQQQRAQQQQAQEAAKQAAQQQKLQQQQAQQAARQAAQQQKQQAQQAARQAAQQQKKQEEEQKKQQDNPPGGN